jgi:hypothetical protein
MGFAHVKPLRFGQPSSTGKLTISINPPTTPSRTPSVSDTRSTAPRCLPTQGDYFPFPRLSVYCGYSLLRETVAQVAKYTHTPLRVLPPKGDRGQIAKCQIQATERSPLRKGEADQQRWEFYLCYFDFDFLLGVLICR